jgi:carboxyl-terminal processing protease
LKDYGLARIIGEKTFGKGSVQEVERFRDQSAMRITIAEWLTPKEKSIEGVGVEPDQQIELNFEEFKKGKDNQLDAAMEYLAK